MTTHPDQGTEDSINRRQTTDNTNIIWSWCRRCGACPVHREDQTTDREEARCRKRSQSGTCAMEELKQRTLYLEAGLVMVFTEHPIGVCRVFPWPRRGEHTINIGINMKINISINRKKKAIHSSSSHGSNGRSCYLISFVLGVFECLGFVLSISGE